MKKCNILLSAFITLLLSCSTNTPDYVLDNRLAIIKLTENMQNQVLATPIVDSIILDYSKDVFTLFYGDGLVLCNPNTTDSILADFIQSKFNLYGTNPYILLDEKYAIIDWKWSFFYPLSGTNRRTQYVSKSLHNSYSINSYYNIENEEYYLLPINWTELDTLTHIWKMEEGQYVEKPKIIYINFRDIENYGNIKNSSRELMIKYNVPYFDMNDVYNLYTKDNGKFNNYVEDMDVLQNAYAETLKEIIKNGDLESLFHSK